MSAGNPGALQGWCFSPIGSRWGKFGPLSVLQREASTHRHKVQAWKEKINSISVEFTNECQTRSAKVLTMPYERAHHPIVNLEFQAWFALQQTCIDQGQQIWNGQKGHGYRCWMKTTLTHQNPICDQSWKNIFSLTFLSHWLVFVTMNFCLIRTYCHETLPHKFRLLQQVWDIAQ